MLPNSNLSLNIAVVTCGSVEQILNCGHANRIKAFISYEAGWYVDKIVLPLEGADKIPKGTVNIKSFEVNFIK